MLLSHISERYTSQASSSSSEMGGSGQTGGLYLNAYEVSFPLEESVERPAAYHLNQGQQMIEGKSHYENYIYYVSVNGKKKIVQLWKQNVQALQKYRIFINLPGYNHKLQWILCDVIHKLVYK